MIRGLLMTLMGMTLTLSISHCSGGEAPGDDPEEKIKVPSDDDDNNPPDELRDPDDYDWSFFFYIAVDNELEGAGALTVDRMLEATAALEDHARIIVLIDVLTEPGTEVFEIVGGEAVPVASYDEQNSSDPAVLEDFIILCLEDFASDQNAVIVKSEGFGWRGICRENTHPEGEVDTLMPPGGIAEALIEAQAATERNVDMLLLEGSSMALIEVVYELRDAADLLLAPQTKIQFEGIPWFMIVEDLAAAEALDPLELAILISDDHRDYWADKGNNGVPGEDISANFASMSTFDLSEASNVLEAHNDYCEVIVPLFPELHNLLPHARDLADIGGYGEITDYDYIFDIVRFQEASLMLIENRGDEYPELEAAINDYWDAHYAMVLHEFHADKYHDRPNGMCIWYPPTYNKYITWDPVGDVTFGSTLIYHDESIGLDWVDDSNWLWYLDEYYRATYNYYSNDDPGPPDRP